VSVKGNDLATVTGAAITFEIGDRTWTFDRPMMVDYGALEQRIKDDQAVLLYKTLKAAGEDREFAARMVKDMAAEAVDILTFSKAMRSARNMAFFAWLCARAHHPNLTIEDLQRDLKLEQLAEITNALFGPTKGKEKAAGGSPESPSTTDTNSHSSPPPTNGTPKP
jgi:hypothetical protein